MPHALRLIWYRSLPMIVNGQPALVLAPMEGVTDAPMRALMGEMGSFSFSFSEFLRVSHEVPPLHVFYRHIPELKAGCRTPTGLPVVIQLLGGDPGRLAAAALLAVEAGAFAIDLNFGCPAKTVNRHDGGATLLKYPYRIFDIVSTIRAALPPHVTLSAKMRLGWDNVEAIHENARQAEAAGASWITIHGRTKEQGYRPPAYWGPIGQVKRALKIPVIANGDIWSLADFKQCRLETGCEHFMIGRGALANPLLSRQIAAELGLVAAAPLTQYPAKEEWRPWLQRYAHWSAGHSLPDSRYLTRRMKQWLKMAQTRGTIDWFDSIKRFEQYKDFAHAMQL